MKTQEAYIAPKVLYNTAQIDHIAFSVLSPEQILSWSVLQITEPKIYEGTHPSKGGVNDSRLGIIKSGQKCETCGLSKECTGHFGHIKLAEPIFHLGYLNHVVKILKCICLNCSKLKYYSGEQQKRRFEQIMMIGNPAKRLNQLAKLLATINRCPLIDKEGQKLGCGSSIPIKITIKQKIRLFLSEKYEKTNSSQNQFSALKVKNILQKIDVNDCKILGFTNSRPTSLIISIIPVAPPQIRPPVELSSGQKAEDDITYAYAKIVAYNNRVKQGLDNYKRNLNVKQIQKIVASIMVKVDQKYLPVLQDKLNNKKEYAKKIKSLQERLIAKQGRFRQHLMGKRVDFCARTVITPDPFIELNQIGVPQSIAKILTFPEQINEFNYGKILNLCKQGKVRFLIDPKQSNGKKQLNYIFLKQYRSQELQEYLKIGMIAERELQNGDYILLNRQPTLHKMSMMGHKVKILPHNTIRLNLSVCSPYNADFDGDQMNLHVPQSVQAVAQLQFIAGVPHQIINPKNSMPIMGIVQDSLLGVYLMTLRDTFITKAQIMNLVMWMDLVKKSDFCELPIPCILKPEPLWSGKQVISMLLPQKITYFNRPKQTLRNINDKQNLIIKDGEILSGILKREHLGPSCGKLLQSIWIQKGPEVTSQFISNVQRVVNNWFMTFGFSVGLQDIQPSQDLQNQRRNQTQKTNRDYYTNIHIFRNLPRYVHQNFHQKGKKIAESLEYKVNLDLNNSLSRMQGIVTKSVSAQMNNICKMIEAKSKGSETNLAQILFCLGNQNVNGQRCPQGFRKRALPHFLKDDNSPQPRGFVFSSFYKGLKPHQFFFHSMAGREGLSDTAVKTSNIGYIQRKLVKALQDLSVRYDGTVRDSKDNILQRFYGEDGFQPEFIQKHRINQCLLKQNQFEAIYKWKQDKLKEFSFSLEEIQLLNEQYQFLVEARNILRERTIRQRQDNVEYDCPINIQRIVNEQISLRTKSSVVQPVKPFSSIRIVEELSRKCILPRFKKIFNDQIDLLEKNPKQGKIYRNKVLLIKNNLLKDFGSQIFNIHLKFWLSSTQIYYNYKIDEKQLRAIADKIYQKYKRVLVSAGEAIGSLAAQSIGEPTTQMTLNTFHLAGVADRNVTLGIPRLRQLLNVSKDIKTPYTIIYPKQPLLWMNKQSQESQYIQNLLIEIIPERSMRYFIVDSKIYFDPGKKSSQIDAAVIYQLQSLGRTPWMIALIFDKQKITSTFTWKLIQNILQKNLGTEFTITQYVGIGESKQPQINVRLNTKTIQRIGEGRAFKHLNLREMQLRDYPISGITGISSVKTSKKRSYYLQKSEQLLLSLDQSIDQLVFEAAGSSLKKILSLPFVDTRRTVSNNIYEIYEILGIQAARKCFLNQFREIFKPYSININPRHLDVLAQWMTFRGNLIPINRHGINRVKDVSVLRKATFEETVDILYNAAAFSQKDQLKGVSEKIIFGQKLNIGTNVCRIFLDENKVGNFVYQPSSNFFLDERVNEEKSQEQSVTRNHSLRTPSYETPKLEQLTSLKHSYMQTPVARSMMLTPVYDENKEIDQSIQSPKWSRPSATKNIQKLQDKNLKIEKNEMHTERSLTYNTANKYENGPIKYQSYLSPTYTNKISMSISEGPTKLSPEIKGINKLVRPSESQQGQQPMENYDNETKRQKDV